MLEGRGFLGRILNKEGSVDQSLINIGFLDSVLTGVGRRECRQLEHAEVRYVKGVKSVGRITRKDTRTLSFPSRIIGTGGDNFLKCRVVGRKECCDCADSGG